MGTTQDVDDQDSDDGPRAWDGQGERGGAVSARKTPLLRNLPTYRADHEWYLLASEAEAIVGSRGVLLFCHAISTANGCLLCSSALRQDLVDLGEDPDRLELTPGETLLVEFGRTTALPSPSFPEALLRRLQRVFSDAELTVLTGFAGIMIATNIFNSLVVGFQTLPPEDDPGA